MARYISLDEAINKIHTEGILGAGWGDSERESDVIDMLERCAEVEVVRCKDCKFYHKQECAMDDWHFAETKEDDFCSFGKKKEEVRDNG